MDKHSIHFSFNGFNSCWEIVIPIFTLIYLTALLESLHTEEKIGTNSSKPSQ